ncbi:replication factor A protein 1-like [Acyrthosiphon pisum]|uniref:Uncharacterized protein n=1 Tax=Acyrthosiphon pisum TaxID=7029 RepID=A0A8R2AFQ3_ACYPI|nr:replication factor A protein 1-like [Acyrthosiphon pisum]|eukprot:XP_003248874.1 PREDICTED: replication factor A protein 1-like [Acyrthosiphon pisum]
MEYDIADLNNDLNGDNWSITVRVLKKSNKISYQNERGTGKYFTTILIDKTTEIRAKAFGDDCDRLFLQLQENNVYNIKNGKIQLADKEYNNSKNDYEIFFKETTIIIEQFGFTDIPTHPQLKTIENFWSMDINTLIDTIGVIIKIEKSKEIKKKNSNDTYKLRDIILKDKTGFSVTVVLWDTEAINFNANEGDIMSIIDGQIIVFKNVNKISVTGSSEILINPRWKVTEDLQSWYKEFEKKELLNLSQMSIGSQEHNTSEISQCNRNKTINERILQENIIEDYQISERLLKLHDEVNKKQKEITDLNFKKQRLSNERESLLEN